MMHKKPPFLNGSFLWRKLGYRYSEPSTLDLLTKSALNSENSWIVVASVLSHAKHGDHAPVRLLERRMREETDDYFLLCVCAELLGDAGTEQDLEVVRPMILDGPDVLRAAAWRAAHWSGYLWLVPAILDAWNLISWRDERDTISAMLSDLLEAEAGPITANEGYSPAEYSTLVQSKIDQMRMDFGTDRIPIWKGRIFGVKSLAKHYYEMLLELDGESIQGFDVDMEDCRRKFESATGIDCSSFFKDEKFQPLAATAILEEFLESADADKYEEGVRYFFGHRIPD